MKYALVFPGQGSQFVGMGKIFYENFKIFKQTLEEGSDALSLDFKKLIFEGPDSELKLTYNTQPSLLLVSVGLDRILKDFLKNQTQIVCGHSLGEYSALVSNSSIPFSDAIKCVRKRGEEMQKAVPIGQGGMLAVLGVENDNVQKICDWVVNQNKNWILTPANFNSPGQVVISGHSAACEWLTQNFKTSHFEFKAKFISLPVSAPFHCPLMMEAQKNMEPVLNQIQFQKPNCPIIQNVTAMETQSESEIRKNLISQISAPVKWTQSVERLKQLEAQRVIEVGPSKVLSGLVKKIDSSFFQTFNIESLEDIKKIEELVCN